ncbi:MAG TPA: hypothetical protein EYP85_11070 [Armatimonadetes bacterium]|nr:hypothetical protein [Armatimonadota bacterium]
MTEREVVTELARRVRALVRPQLGQGRQQVGIGASGDAAFALDLVAEEAVENFLREQGLSVAYYSEDRGLVGDPAAERLLILDPIDGSRPAKAGFETCCVSVALARNRPRATMAEVTHACVADLKGNALFYAERGGGVLIEGDPLGLAEQPAEPVQPCLSTVRDPYPLAVSVELAGRPVRWVAEVLSEVLDGSSLPGGVFAFASSTYSLTRVVTGQLDAFLDVGHRIYQEIPASRPDFLRAGQGHLIALFPYDLAAAVLIAQEAGAVVTDAYGQPFTDVLLTDVSLANARSCIAAANAELHQRLLEIVNANIARLRGA